MTKAKKGVIKGKTQKKTTTTKTNKDPIFVGIDPSFNATGVILLDKNGDIIEQKLISSNSKESAEERLIDIRNQLSFIPIINNLKIVYFEGPSYSSNGQFALQMGALHFMTRMLFFESKVNYKIIAPGALKKFVTGKGNAKKNLMLMKVFKKWKIEFSDDNLCDAFSLAQLALNDYNNLK